MPPSPRVFLVGHLAAGGEPHVTRGLLRPVLARSAMGLSYRVFRPVRSGAGRRRKGTVHLERNDQMPQSSEPPVRSIARCLDVLSALSAGPAALREVASGVNLSKATAHRLLAALAHGAFVIQDPESGRYMLGPALLLAADSAIESFSGLGILAMPSMEGLRQASDETVALHIRVGSRRICIAELPSAQPMRFTCGVGETSPIHTGSAGKLLLAYASPETQSLIIDHGPLEALTDYTVTDPAALRAELDTIRERGWSDSRSERNPGAAGLSAPVFYDSDHIAAAVSVFGPEQRLTPRFDELREPLLRAAAGVTDALTSASAV